MSKPREKYVHQATPNAPIMEFSDAPCVVHGVRYYPRWAWSADYRKHFRALHARVRPVLRDDRAVMKQYVRHMVTQKGFDSMDEAVKALHANGSVAYPYLL